MTKRRDDEVEMHEVEVYGPEQFDLAYAIKYNQRAWSLKLEFEGYERRLAGDDFAEFLMVEEACAYQIGQFEIYIFSMKNGLGDNPYPEA